jgi:glycosyltransferase involved in cell wall biosynthesis
MRIALFTDTYTPDINGVARTYQRLTAYMRDQGVEIKIFAPAGGKDTGMEYNITRFFGLDFFLYPECKLSFPNYFTIHSELEEFKPDLIHIATPFVLGLAGLKYAKSHDVPTVAVFHTNFPQYLKYYRIPWLKKAAWRFLRWFHAQVDRTFCPSTETKKLLTRHGIPNLDIWRRGVEQHVFSPKWSTPQLREHFGVQNKKVLLYVGRLAPEKNADVLFQALLVANKSRDDLHLVVVGDGPSRSELELIAPANVTFLGYKSGEELSRLYASADIFVCPSVTETFGNVILEAMASRLPVVAPLAGGIKENLFPNITGLACLAHNYLSMASAICQLAADDELRSRLAKNAYNHATSQSWDAIFSGLLKSYEEVIINRGDQRVNSAV